MIEGAISTVIVEDEEPSRNRLKRLLAVHRDTINIVAEADNGIDAAAVISELRPRLLFLDIQLPGIDGMKVLEKLPYKPAVIFTSAYHEYALDAFKAVAIDYLLKPIDAAMLEKAIEKLKLVGFRQESITEKLEYLLSATQNGSQTNRIPLRVGDRIDLVNFEDILYFQADNKYTRVKTTSKEYVIDMTLLELEQKLNPVKFVRIHRGSIVNLDWVAELHKWFGGRLKVRLRDDEATELLASRTYAANLVSW